MNTIKLYNNIKNEIPNNVSLIVVSKMQSIEKIKKIYSLGHRNFGENKVQELIRKKLELPNDIKWHLIGHLQSKKIKKILPFIDLIHSIDSLELIEKIQKEAKILSKKIKLLLQIKIAQENSKFGLNYYDCQIIMDLYKKNRFPNLIIKGLMGIATFTKCSIQIKNEFVELKKYFDKIKKNTSSFSILSMGMSNDYKIAINVGSNMIRVGKNIFL